ncbi:pre-rRNA-processing protein esf1 [Tulasnella sp. 418]|nr:pre-rRNA-processing protein esf1 [Tulasnella sp. 418]
MSDPRFARLRSDPRFRKLRKRDTKVVLDERFKSIFDDAKKDIKGKGKGKARVDKYGRKISSNQEKDNLRRFYRLEGSEDDDEAGPSKPKAAPDLARGEVLLESSSEDEEGEKESDDESDNGGFIPLEPPTPSTSKRKSKPKRLEEQEVDLDESQFAVLDAQAADAIERDRADGDQDGQRRTTAKGEETARLAVVNLDWDHVKASHLFKAFASVAALCDVDPSARRKKDLVTPTSGGKVLSVRVYPSEFGKARLAKEEKEGPPMEIFNKKKSAGAILRSGGPVEEDEIDEEDINEKTIFKEGDADQYDQDALRKYQLERLRYYYAIVTFDSPKTAAHVYTELDGTEFERSANVFDLSYVPDDMMFDEEFRDEATQDLGNYAPVDFVTDALRHSKVKLTWDDDDPTRTSVTRRALTKKEIEENDFRALVASSSGSSGDEDDPEASSKSKSNKLERDKLRALLLGGGDDEEAGNDLPEGWGGASYDKAGEMEITFTPGLSAKKGREEEENTLHRYLKKQKEKREKRKTERLEKRKEKEEPTEAKRAGVREDDFFAADSEDNDEHEDAQRKQGNEKPRNSGRPDSPPPDITTIITNGSNTTQGNGDHEPKHFDMKAVIKAEKAESRKNKKGKKKKQRAEQDVEVEDGRGFEINVGDSRFSALHEEAEFAIDPSHPHFKPTKSMKELLAERSRRLKDKLREDEVAVRKKKKDLETTKDTGDLSKLVESVKRKSSVAMKGAHGEGKRRKLQ